MRITLADLQKDRRKIDLLDIISLEGQRYMARLRISDELLLLSDAKGQTCLFRSAWEIQDTLKDIDIKRTDVVHASAYHEMVGMEPANIEPLRINVQGQRS